MSLEPAIFVGDANDAEARVYAMLPRTGLPEDARLSGELAGPYCRYSQTLPARIRFLDRGPGATLLAEAIVPDPCFWTPDLPFMYSAELRIVSGDAGSSSVPLLERRPVAIRRLGVRDASIYLDAKRFVLRGLRRPGAAIEELKDARSAGTALYVDHASNDFLREASEEGVPLVLNLQSRRQPAAGSDDLTRVSADLARVGRWPAVAIVVLDGGLPVGRELRQLARNTLLAHNITNGQPDRLAPWAHLFWWPTEIELRSAITLPNTVPIVAFRDGGACATIEEGRLRCDRLQADLASFGDFAGYFT